MLRKSALTEAPATGSDLRVRVLASIGDVSAATWDACAGAGSSSNPFTRHAFLSALEVSKSATARTGWQPQRWPKHQPAGRLPPGPCGHNPRHKENERCPCRSVRNVS